MMNTMNMMINDAAVEEVNGGWYPSSVNLSEEECEKIGAKIPAKYRGHITAIWVRKTDNLERIAWMYQTTVKSIMLINENYTPSMNFQKIYIPLLYKGE